MSYKILQDDHKLCSRNQHLWETNTQADADLAGNKIDSKSISGNIFKLGKTPMQRYTKKQPYVVMSSAEAEYVLAASAAQ